MPSTAVVSGVEFTRYIQSSFKVKANGVVVWIDPVRIMPAHVGDDKADLVLITHPHQDHFDMKALAACRKPDAPVFASPAAAQQLAKKGVAATVLWEGQSATAAGLQVTALPGYNGMHLRSKQFNVGFRFKLGGATVYHAGDTDAVPEMAQVGPVDVAMLPIGGVFVMDEAEAAQAVGMVRAANVIPMHYGFATGGDPARLTTAVGDKAKVVVLDAVVARGLPTPVRALVKLMGGKRKKW
ncbi:MAG: MBL fold metallo-hydrolase [Chloroflexi bacterium]|nr:MBL fold metallo-hydrolase [Chloroflexota bacterium]